MMTIAAITLYGCSLFSFLVGGAAVRGAIRCALKEDDDGTGARVLTALLFLTLAGVVLAAATFAWRAA